MLGPRFITAVASILTLVGLLLYPLIGAEAFEPLKQFLDTQGIARTLVLSTVLGITLLTASGVQQTYLDEKARNNTKTIEGFLASKTKSAWTPRAAGLPTTWLPTWPSSRAEPGHTSAAGDPTTRAQWLWKQQGTWPQQLLRTSRPACQGPRSLGARPREMALSR